MLILCLIKIVISSRRSEEFFLQKLQQTQELLQMIENGKLQEVEDIMSKAYKLNIKEYFKDLSEEKKKETMIYALNKKLKKYQSKLLNESSYDLTEKILENNLSSDELFNKRNTKLIKERNSLKRKLPRNTLDKQNQMKDKLIVITHSTLIGNNFTEISIAPKKVVKKEPCINDKERESSDREYIKDVIKVLTEINEVPHINIKKKELFNSDYVKEGMNASEEIKKEKDGSNIDDKSLINNELNNSKKDDTNLTDKVMENNEYIKENKSNDQVMSSNELNNNELTNALEPLVIINNDESNNSQLNDNSLTKALEPMAIINNDEEINDIQRELSINNQLNNNELNNKNNENDIEISNNQLNNNELNNNVTKDNNELNTTVLSNNNVIDLYNNFINKYFIKLEEELENNSNEKKNIKKTKEKLNKINTKIKKK